MNNPIPGAIGAVTSDFGLGKFVGVFGEQISLFARRAFLVIIGLIVLGVGLNALLNNPVGKTTKKAAKLVAR